MEIKINEKAENPLLERQKIEFEVAHPGAPTPPRAEVLEKLSSKLGASKDLIVIEKIATLHGRQTASGIARVYESENHLKEFESEYLIERTKASEEKIAEAEGEAEEEEEEVKEPEEAEKEAEKAPEEAEEEAPAKEGEEPTGREEIDYQAFSKKNISEIKEEAKERDLDYQKLLEAEKENKDRKTLKKWLREKTESAEEE